MYLFPLQISNNVTPHHTETNICIYSHYKFLLILLLITLITKSISHYDIQMLVHPDNQINITL